MSRRPSPPDRHLARALAMQGLYQWRISGADEASIEAHLPEFADYRHEGHEENESGVRRKADMTLCATLLRGVIREHETLIEELSLVLDRPFAELSPVEAAILLMSTWELANCPEIPYRVVLNEAIELAKQFGSNEGHRYVNGVLDKVAGRLRGQEARAKKKEKT